MREQGGVQTRFAMGMQFAVVMVFAVAAIYYVAVSLHWRLMVDSSVMHYVVFLMRHGLRPYSDISDNNMPGSYLTEAAAMRLFGGGDLGWRLYEYFLLTALTISLVLIARRGNWLAGVFAAGMFIVLHSAEGAQYAAEREEVITVLLLVGFVLLFAAVRQQQALLLLPWGVVCALAASIKPTYLPLPLMLLVMALLVLRRRKVPWGPYLLWAALGLSLMAAIDLEFLLHYHAVAGFVFILRYVLPAYGGMARMSWGHLATLSLPRTIALQVPIVVALVVANARRGVRWDWERWALILGAGFGFVSFMVQRKGFLHHRYTFVVLMLLLMGMEIVPTLRTEGWARVVGAAILLINCCVLVPHTLRVTQKVVGHSDLELSLERDLQRLGGPAALQDKVQCFDLVYGCLDALYHMGIVENSGFTGDLLFFPAKTTFPVTYYRSRFWELAKRDPAEVMVVSNQKMAEANGFDKLQRWPEFDAYLRDNYTEVAERRFPYEHFGGRFAMPSSYDEQDAYRIYLRHGSLWLKDGDGLKRLVPQ